MSAIDESEQRGQKPKKKKKKKKKKMGESNQNQNMQQQQQQAEIDAMNSKDYGGNLLEVAARFGLSDLRLPGGGGISSATESDRGFDNGTNGGGGSSGAGSQSKDNKNSFHDGGHGGRGGGGRSAENLSVEEMKPSWDGGLLLGGLPSQQMHLLYHSLARSHPTAAHGDGGSSMGGGLGSGPCNLSGNNDAGAGSSANNLRQPTFCHDRAPMSSPDHTFIMNSSSVPMRYLPSVGVADNTAARHVNPMLFSPRSATRNIGHFGSTDMNMPAEAAMISQYIQSQQRFAPPVWGFANPNYHNY